MNDYILFKNLEDAYLTLPELLVKEEKAEEETADAENASTDSADTKETDAEVVDKDGNSIDDGDSAEDKDERKIIYYVTDVNQQGQYIKLFKEQNMQAVILDHNIDTSFISQLEQRNEQYKFMRIDADLTESLKDETDAEDLKDETDTLTEIFKKALNNEKLTVKVEKLKNENISSIITLSEEGRRMQDMMKMYSMGGNGMDMGMFGGGETLVLNSGNKLVQYILDHKEGEHVELFCKQLYDLAMIAHKPLPAEEMTDFVARSNEIMMLLTK